MTNYSFGLYQNFLDLTTKVNIIKYSNFIPEGYPSEYSELSHKISKKDFMYYVSYLKMAYIWAENSYSERMKVGALLVKDNSIIADGFNGTPIGFDNKCEDNDGNTLKEVLHAESNLLMKIAKSNNSSKDSILFCTLSPCIDCAKLIIQAEIKTIVFSEIYRITDGLEFLFKYRNIDIVYINKSIL